MNIVPAIPPASVQVPEPVCEGEVDELRDTLVPAQEDELPQGALDLLAMLITRHRPERLILAGNQGLVLRGGDVPFRDQAHSDRGVHSNVVERVREQPRTHIGMHFPVGATARRFDLLAKAPVQTPINLQGSPRESIEAPSIAPKPLPIERAFDAPSPEALMNLHSPRHSPSVAAMSVPLPSAPVPKPALDVVVETLPGASRDLLQIPFNKGNASGQVTITRLPDEPVQHLQLSPSNALVLEQLKAPFELVRDHGWRLTDDGDDQQHQGSRQPPDEEPVEELPA